MARCCLRLVLGCTLALAACATDVGIPPDFPALLAESPEPAPARLWLAEGRVVAAAVALGTGALPPAVRQTLEAVAPRGEVTFQGREWGPRGDGFRIEKLYRIDGADHTRSALIAADGTVLERTHSVPLDKTPQAILATAMQEAQRIDDVQIVSGREREECWRLLASDRLGRTLVLTIGLDGRRIGSLRRVAARLDV
jgi:hypothetical protein